MQQPVYLLGVPLRQVVGDFVDQAHQVVQRSQARRALGLGVGLDGGGPLRLVDLAVQVGGAAGERFQREQTGEVAVLQAPAALFQLGELAGIVRSAGRPGQAYTPALGDGLLQLPGDELQGFGVADHDVALARAAAPDVHRVAGAETAIVEGPQAGAALGAAEQPGELVGFLALVFLRPTAEFGGELAVGVFIPERLVPALGDDGFIGGHFAVAGTLAGAWIQARAGHAPAHVTGVEGIAQHVADGLRVPALAAAGRALAGFLEHFGDLHERFAGQEHIPCAQEQCGLVRVLDRDGAAVAFPPGRLAVAEGDLHRQAALGCPARHGIAILAAQIGDLGLADDAAHALHDIGGVGGVGVEFSAGQRLHRLGDGVDLYAVMREGFGDRVEQVAQAVVVVHHQQVEAAALGVVEHGVQGRDGLLGIAQVHPAGAGFAGYNVRPGGLAPGAGLGGFPAAGLLLGEGDLVAGGLGFGGDGGPDGDAVHLLVICSANNR